MISDRERFCVVLASGPLLRGDAIVVLAGEDAEARGAVALELFRQGAAPVVVCSGGIQDPPRRLSGDAAGALLLARGLAPDRILIEPASQNTREQAVNVLALAIANEWHRLLLVASPYHLPRAFLTFLKAIQEADGLVPHACDTIQLVAVPASQMPWWGSPPGTSALRLDLLADEYEKIHRYREHVAGYAEGLAYLRYWEGK